MTTDPTPLQERIARAMWAGFAADQGYTTTWEELAEYVQGTYLHAAAAVLPILAAEVRKAQADAWDEGQRAGIDDGLTVGEIILGVKDGPPPGPTPNPYRNEED